MIEMLNVSKSTENEIMIFFDSVVENIKFYPYYHYRLYPSKNEDDWMKLFLIEFKKALRTKGNVFFYMKIEDEIIFTSYTVNKWDEDHFGIKMAKSGFSFCLAHHKVTELSVLIASSIVSLKELGVKFISTRINGDSLEMINAHILNDFRYIENIIWPVKKVNETSKLDYEINIVKTVDELAEVKEIAQNDQYQRGHFHCDDNFEKIKVDQMYSKWVESSFYSSNDIICCIKKESTIIGYFICSIDTTLSNVLGYKYGRFKSLALNSNYRGLGFGSKLFSGTIQYLENNVCEYIDSGYATKNHGSAFLHSRNDFYSVYEEVSLHKWI
jgi:L-amino acid N-acyltransferase YncA